MKKIRMYALLFVTLLLIALLVFIVSRPATITPLVSGTSPGDTYARGLAMAYYRPLDLFSLGPNLWFYDWGSHLSTMPAGYIPMSKCGEDPLLPSGYYGYALLYNEPNNPYQCDYSPHAAAIRYSELHAQYPLTKWVVGNELCCGYYWLQYFHTYCNEIYSGNCPVNYWGIHMYPWDQASADYIINSVTNTHIVVGGYFWITEFADTLDDPPYGEFNTADYLTDWFKETSWIKRWAYFTNYCTYSIDSCPWPSSNLFYAHPGDRTELGDWYAFDR